LRCSQQALHYAKVADDLNLQVVAMRQIAISFDCIDRPDKVLEMSQQALPLIKHVSPLLQSCIYAGISGAYAELGSEQEARRYMGLAYEYFPDHPEGEPGYLHTICRYSTLVFFDGLNQLELGYPDEAEKFLRVLMGYNRKYSYLSVSVSNC
jgi:tetratricopeptide (TPR) repeat protein